MPQRFAAAKRAGFDGVEVLFPYDLAAKELARAATANGLEFVLLNAPPPNWSGGPRGFAADPALVERFRRDFDRALRYAEALRARHIHVMAGKAKGPEAHETFVQNLKWATDRAPHASLTIEPLNSRDMPGYFLNNFDLAAQVIEQVGARNLGLQFDAYHAHLITGDVTGTWQDHRQLTRHVQIAAPAGRAEPEGTDIDFPAFFDLLDSDGYKGWVSAEYNPSGRTEAGLDWLPRNS